MSGMVSGLSGIQNATQSLAVNASKVAADTGPGSQAARLKAPDALQLERPPEAVRQNQEPAPQEGNGDLAVDAMNLKTDKVTYEANLQFMQIQSSLLGTAVDMKA